MPSRRDEPESFTILGTAVSAVSISQTISLFQEWVGGGQEHVVVLRDVHGIMRARSDPVVRGAQEAADLVPPDGMPIVWLMRLSGFKDVSRVCGIDLLPQTCRYGLTRGWRHFLYGAAPGVAEALADSLRATFPGIEIVGVICPPFRPPTPEEDEAHCAEIQAARPDFLWVSLSTPKQDIWMKEHRGRFPGITMIGVGGAFEINAGLIRRAPGWMQSYGLEWLYRLMQEPRRLWRRYFQALPLFVVLGGAEFIRRKVDRMRSAHNLAR